MMSLLQRKTAMPQVLEFDEFVKGLEQPQPNKKPNGYGGAPGTADKGNLLIRRASDIEPQPIEWLWPGKIAIGKQTLIVGEPGLGKSQLSAFLAAAVTTGADWPCGDGI